MNSAFIMALATLVGTIVGAGTFGIPFVVQKSGLLAGVFYFAFLGAAVTLLHLFFGEVCLRTKEKHRIAGYANMYLGPVGKLLGMAILLFALVGALLVYLIIAGNFLSLIFSPMVGISSAAWSFVFWAAVSLLIAGGIQLISRLEVATNLVFFILMGVIFFFALPHIKVANFSLLAANGIFIPFGVLFFAFAGWDAIPEIADFLKQKRDKAKLEEVIVWGSVVTAVLYALLVWFVVGVSGAATSQDAFSGLQQFLGRPVIVLGAIAAVITIADSFLVLGNYLKNSLYRDFGISKPLATIVAMGLPLLLFGAGLREFIGVIGFVGSIMGVAEGVLIILMFHKAKTKGDRVPEFSLNVPPFLLWGMGILLAAGALAAVVL